MAQICAPACASKSVNRSFIRDTAMKLRHSGFFKDRRFSQSRKTIFTAFYYYSFFLNENKKTTATEWTSPEHGVKAPYTHFRVVTLQYKTTREVEQIEKSRLSEVTRSNTEVTLEKLLLYTVKTVGVK